MGLTGVSGYFAEMQGHAQVRVAVAHGHERPGARALYAQLFVQFAGQGLFQGLALFHLAAGELPQTALVFVLGAAAEAEAVIAVTDDGGDDNDFGDFGHGIGPETV